jgi:hypothetical protein
VPRAEMTISNLQRKPNGWFEAETDHPSIRKLATKLEPKAREMQALQLSGTSALIEYSMNERHDELSGRTYQNYYFESAITGQAPEAPPIPAAPVETQRPTDPGTAWRISLAAGAKLAVHSLQFLPEEQRSLPEQQRMALRWGYFLATTPMPQGPPAPPPASSPPPHRGAYDEPAAGWEPPPPSVEDDIPF